MLTMNLISNSVVPFAVEPSTQPTARTRRNLAKFLHALDLGFTAVGQKAEDNRTNPFWLEVETFDGLVRVLYENAAPYITMTARDGRRCEYGSLNRQGAIVLNVVESALIQ